jgi:hypothetical protein
MTQLKSSSTSAKSGPRHTKEQAVTLRTTSFATHYAAQCTKANLSPSTGILTPMLEAERALQVEVDKVTSPEAWMPLLQALAGPVSPSGTGSLQALAVYSNVEGSVPLSMRKACIWQAGNKLVPRMTRYAVRWCATRSPQTHTCNLQALHT